MRPFRELVSDGLGLILDDVNGFSDDPGIRTLVSLLGAISNESRGGVNGAWR